MLHHHEPQYVTNHRNLYHSKGVKIQTQHTHNNTRYEIFLLFIVHRLFSFTYTLI